MIWRHNKMPACFRLKQGRGVGDHGLRGSAATNCWNWSCRGYYRQRRSQVSQGSWWSIEQGITQKDLVDARRKSRKPFFLAKHIRFGACCLEKENKTFFRFAVYLPVSSSSKLVRIASAGTKGRKLWLLLYHAPDQTTRSSC